MAGLTLPQIKPSILQPGEEEKQLVRGYQQESKALEGRLAPIQQERTKLEGEMRGIGDSMPTPPKLQEVPQFQPRQVDQQEMMTFAGIATALAALGAKAVRGDITVALTAAAGALKGFNEGNIQQTKIDIENFNTTMRGVVAQNNQMLNEYKAVLEDRKLNLAQKMQQYSVLAHKFQDEIAIAGIRKGDIKMELDRLDKVRIATNQIELKVETMKATMAAQFGRMEAMIEMQKLRDAGRNPGGAGDTQLTPQAVELLARESLKNPSVLVGLGRGVQGARDLRSVRNKQAEILAAEGGAGMAQRAAEFRADSNSLNKMTMSYDAITAFEQTAVRNGRTLVDLANKVDVTGIPVIERWVRAGRQTIAGDPDVSTFHAQMMLYRSEAARILVNPNLTGQLTDSARHEVQEFLSSNDSAPQISRVVSLLERDFDNRKHTLERQMEAARERMTVGYGAGTQPGGERKFASEAEAEAAGLKPGDRVIINGVPGTWR